MTEANTMLLDFQKKILDEAWESLHESSQAAIHVFTSGGKSYIAKRLMEEVHKEKGKLHVLWISTKSAITNVKSTIFNDDWYNSKITYITYTSLSRSGDNIVNIISLYEYNLIIIDEAHRGLAEKTEIGIKAVLDNFSDVYRVTMSATPTRMQDRRNAFSILTPDARYQSLDIDEAIKQGLLPKINYYILNLKLLKRDYKYLETYEYLSETYSSIRNELIEIKNFIENYQFSVVEDSVKLIKNTLTYDGSKGDRYIVFFSTIAELEAMKAKIKKIFKRVYSKQCNINIYKYHSKCTKEELQESFDGIMSEPKENNIDVMLTVDMGTESIHPKNIRGILMYRATKSERVYKQQLGRAIKLKKDSNKNDEILIYDFIDNFSMLSQSETLNNGKVALSERNKSRAITTDIDAIRKRVESYFNSNNDINIVIANQSIQECIERINLLNTDAKAIEQFGELAKILEHNKDKSPINFYDYLNKDSEYLTDWEKTQNWFFLLQRQFLSHNYLNECSELKLRMLENLGISAYVTKKATVQSIKGLLDIQKVSANLALINYDYTRLEEIDGLKKEINSIRDRGLRNVLSIPERMYAIRHGIDIDFEKATEEDLDFLSFSDRSEHSLTIYNHIIKLLEDEDSDEKSKCHYIKGYIYAWSKDSQSRLSYALRKQLDTKYKNTLDTYKINEHDAKVSSIITSALLKVKSITPFTLLEEQFILKVSGKGLNVESIDYIKGVGDYFNVNVTDVKTFSTVLFAHTEWYYAYKRVIKSKSLDAFQKITNFNTDKLGVLAKRLLLKDEYINAKNSIQGLDTSLMVQKLVKTLYNYNSESLEIIRRAFKNGKISEAEILASAFPADQFKEAVNYFVNIPCKNENELKACTKSKILCVDTILDNLLKLDIFSKNSLNKINALYE